MIKTEPKPVIHTGKVGRPKLFISPEDMARAEEYAFEGCKNGTICGLMDWNIAILADRPDILKKLTLKRQERSLWLRSNQNRQIRNPVMAIWLGKQDVSNGGLGQTDKTEVKHGMSEQSAAFQAWLEAGNAPQLAPVAPVGLLGGQAEAEGVLEAL